MSNALLQTDLGSLPLTARGKVRDIYALGDKQLLFIATDRISAFDHVLGSGIPDKGRILTQLSLFWFDFLKDPVRNHLIAADTRDYPSQLQPYATQLERTSLPVKRAELSPRDCSVRYGRGDARGPGGAQTSSDKQYVRDSLESSRRNKQAPAPALPDEVVTRTREKYLKSFRLISGRPCLANAQTA